MVGYAPDGREVDKAVGRAVDKAVVCDEKCS
jgi:hypothetical protein